MDRQYHTPVLSAEVLSFLQPFEGGIYVDATLGGGGHALRILESTDGRARVVGFDRDPAAIDEARRSLERFADSLSLVPSNFDAVDDGLRRLGVRRVDGFLFDLGVSSRQLEDSGRGFSFQQEGPVDMRMDPGASLTGGDVVNAYPEEDLKRIFREYGEERNAGRIARRIVHSRAAAPIRSTAELADAVRRAAGGRFILKTLARVFQAIRIEVNDELGSLRRALAAALPLLSPGGRIVVISYNSLEDRIVKTWMRAEAGEAGRLRALTKKPVVPSEAEVAGNRRARSAKLRAAERIGE